MVHNSLGRWRYCCSERIWNNYVEIHRKCIHVMLIMVWSTLGYNSQNKWSDQAAWSLKENTSTSWSDIFFNVSDQLWYENDQNEMKLHWEYDYESIRNSMSTFPVSRGLQSICHGQLSKVNNTLNFLTSSAVNQGGGILYFIVVSPIYM